ncbi:MAG: NAD(P)/FAD-dependent oxidoreductase [Thermoplasmata archaeon]
MAVAVIGGGVTGLFTALYLKRAGETVTIYERSRLGAGSVHAAGILEGPRSREINNWAYLRIALRHLRTGSSRLGHVDADWLGAYLRNFGKTPTRVDLAKVFQMGSFSTSEYRALAEQADDFDLSFGGLTEVYDSPVSFRAAQEELVRNGEAHGARVTAWANGGGTLHHPDLGWLDTDLLVARLVRELEGIEVVVGEVGKVSLKGTVSVGGRERTFDTAVLAAGVACRRMGIPLTSVKGFGWRIRTREQPRSAVIFEDSGFAVVPLSHGCKATGGFDFSFSGSIARASALLDRIRKRVDITEVGPVQTGHRPTTPDGLPVVGRRESVVAATGGFMLGWTLGPGIARVAADLALHRGREDPFLGRFLHGMRDGDLTGAFAQ